MYGKILGAMAGLTIGLALSSPEAAGALLLVGAVLGHFVLDRDADPVRPRVERAPTVDELLSDHPPPRRPAARPPPRAGGGLRDTLPDPPAAPATAREFALASGLCPVFIELARIDGEVRRDEVRVVREFFERTLATSEGGLEAVRLALKAALQAKPREIDELVKEVRAHVPPADRLQVVDALYDLALVDGPLTQSETNALKRAVGQFNLSEEQLQEITRRRMGSGSAHYASLGVEETSTDEELKTAFRRLAAENHPDRVASQGPAAVAQAAARFREVKDAYEALRKLRGF